MNYYFHDGESDWGSNGKLYDAILLKSSRIGHGFNLLNFPYLQEQVKCKQIALEVCPISNSRLDFAAICAFILERGTLNVGSPCRSITTIILLTILGCRTTSGNTHGLDTRSNHIKTLCANSIIYSSLSPCKRKQQYKDWMTSWCKFVDDALSQVGMQTYFTSIDISKEITGSTFV